MSKAIVRIDIPTDYADEYKQWLIDGRLYYLEDGAWTFLKEVECEVEPYREAIPIEWIKKWFSQFYGEQGLEWNRCKRFMLEDWEKENEKDSE